MAVVVNSSPKRRDEFLETQRGKELIAVTLILDVKTRWNSTLAMLERAYRLRPYIRCWLRQYPQFTSLYTTEEEWKAVEYVLQVLLPFRYWTLWMSKRQSITLHRVITIYNDMFDHMESVLKALAKKRTQWKKDIHKAVRAGRAKLREYYSNVTPGTGLLLILATILDPFRKLRTFERWDKDMGVSNDNADSYTRQYSDAFLDYWEKNYVIGDGEGTNEVKKEEFGGPLSDLGENVSIGKKGGGIKVYTIDSSDEDTDEEVTAKPNSTPRSASRKAYLMQQARQYLANGRVDPNTLPQNQPQGDDLLSEDPEEVTASFWYPDVGGWWYNQEKMLGEYRDLAKMARDIFSVMPHGVGVEASFSLGRDVIGWRQSKTSGITLQQKVVVRQWARSNDGLFPEEIGMLDISDNDNEEKRQKEDRKLNQLASIKDFITFTNESRARKSYQRQVRQTKDTSIAGFGYISDSEEYYDVDWNEFDDNGAGAFEDSSGDRRPLNLRSGTTKMSYGNLVGRIRRVERSCSDMESNIDPALSEAEAVWMFSDSDEDETGESDNGSVGEGKQKGKASEDDEEDLEGDNEEEVGPENGLLIPGFRRVIRRSTRLELRAMGKGKESILQKRGRGQTGETNSKRRR